MIFLTIAVYIIAAIWTLGCIGAACIAAMTFREECRTTWGAISLSALTTPLALFIAALPWFMIVDYYSPVLATLHEREWVCTAHSTVSTTMVISSGKTTSVVPTTTTQCNTYVRVG